MASYLFYSPQLDGVPVTGNVPQLDGMQHGVSLSSPQVGRLGGLSGQSRTMYPSQHFVGHSAPPSQPLNRELTDDMSFLAGNERNAMFAADNRGQPSDFLSNQQRFLPYAMPAVYTSPYFSTRATSVGPTYSPMFGMPASPMMFGVHQERRPVPNFDPLPDSSWDKPEVGFHSLEQQPTHSEMYHQPMGPPQRYETARVAHFPITDFSVQTQKMHQSLLDDLRGSSQLRNEFDAPRNSSVPHPRAHTLQDIVAEGLVADLATDQNGSRFIQTKLEDASLEEKQMVFEQILPETLRLCTDVFGNYCIQKFFEYGTPEQKQQLARKIERRVLPLSLQMYGCRVVQKAILESVDAETQTLLINELDGHVLECVKDQNANHVIQKCIEQVQSSHKMIAAAFYGRVYDLSTHPYGCRVIQRMLEHCTPHLKKGLLDELMMYADQLAKDQYGNYVLQHVLQHSNLECTDAIIEAVAANILPFSKHKFASNVVERSFVSTDQRQRGILLDAVIGNAETSPLVSMVRDQYGNYVIQKMLETLNAQQRNKLIRKISEYVPNIRKIAFGKHIVAKIEKLTGKVI